MLLHCPAYEHHRAALRTKVARLPAAQASPPVLSDEEGVIAFLRDDFIGGAAAEEATSAAHTFLHAVITFRNRCVELQHFSKVPSICEHPWMLMAMSWWCSNNTVCVCSECNIECILF